MWESDSLFKQKSLFYQIFTEVHLETNKIMLMSCYSMLFDLNPDFKSGNKHF